MFFGDQHKTITSCYEMLSRIVCEEYQLTQMEYDILIFKIMDPSWFEFNPDLSVFKLEMDKEYTFYIEKLTSSKMILTRGEDEHFLFRKF